MQTQFNIHEAKSQLSRLIAQVEAGGEAVIARAGKPVVRLVPVGEAPFARCRYPQFTPLPYVAYRLVIAIRATACWSFRHKPSRCC